MPVAAAVPRYRKLIVAMKPEVTYATDVFAGTYVAGDVVRAFGIVPAITREEIENLSAAGDLGRMASMIGAEYVGVQFTQWLRGAGAAYSVSVLPDADMPLRACGLSSTLDNTGGAEKYTYAPTDSHEAFTVYVAQLIAGASAGPTYKMVGCQGTVDFAGRAGGVIEARFTIMGKLAGVADITYHAPTSVSEVQYPVLKSAAFKLDTGNYAPRIAQVGVRLNNAMQRIPSINDASGVAGFFIADRAPRITIDPEIDTVANYDWWTKWATLPSAASPLSFQAGVTQYFRAKFNFPRVQIVGQSTQARDGLTAVSTQLLAMIANGSDDFSLVFD
jgi:hypothetical protein